MHSASETLARCTSRLANHPARDPCVRQQLPGGACASTATLLVPTRSGRLPALFAAVCTPFPSERFQDAQREKDFQACMDAMQHVPGVRALASPPLSPAAPRMPAATRALLSWLFLRPNRRRRFRSLSTHDLLAQLRQRHPACRLPCFSPHSTPAHALQSLDAHREPAFRHSVLAFHGTHLENLHSILHCGLQNASGTKLQRNGAIFGGGIYLSTSYDVAFTFAQPHDSGWSRSTLGRKLRCLLVCEVDGDKYQDDMAVTNDGEQ